MIKKNILITSAGVATAINVISSLRKSNKYIYNIIAIDMNNDSAGLYLANKFYIVKPSKESGFLEDLIQLQKIEFEIIRGYYYNEGRNNNLKPVISHIFEERVKQKKLGNPIQNSYKLLMNSSYGKTCQKPIETDTKFISVNKEEEYISKYFDRVLEYEILPNNRDVKIKMIKTINVNIFFLDYK